MTEQQKSGPNIGLRSFATAIVVIFVLMVATYILTLTVPGGEYARITDASGNTVIDTEGGFTEEGYIFTLRYAQIRNIAEPKPIRTSENG